MSTPARRKANAAHHQRLREQGARMVAVWMNQDERSNLDRQRKPAESLAACIRRLLKQPGPLA